MNAFRNMPVARKFSFPLAVQCLLCLLLLRATDLLCAVARKDLTQQTEDTRQKLDAVLQHATTSEQQISLIAAASPQQAAASGKISRAVTCISQASGEVSAAAEDTQNTFHFSSAHDKPTRRTHL